MELGGRCAMEHQDTRILTPGMSEMQELFVVSLGIKNLVSFF